MSRREYKFRFGGWIPNRCLQLAAGDRSCGVNDAGLGRLFVKDAGAGGVPRCRNPEKYPRKRGRHGAVHVARLWRGCD